MFSNPWTKYDIGQEIKICTIFMDNHCLSCSITFGDLALVVSGFTPHVIIMDSNSKGYCKKVIPCGCTSPGMDGLFSTQPETGSDLVLLHGFMEAVSRISLLLKPKK